MLAFIYSLILLLASQALCSNSNNPPENPDNESLHVTAIVGKNSESIFQCWEVLPDYSISNTTGTVGARIQRLGDITGASLVLFNPSTITFAGLHPAPAPQFVVFVSGGGYVRLPASGEYLPISKGDIVIANDTAAVSSIGHDSVWFPGTVALQLPFSSGEVTHSVLNDGPCDYP